MKKSSVLWLHYDFLSLNSDVSIPYLQKGISTKTLKFLFNFIDILKRSGSGAGPGSQRYESEDPHLDLYRYQNVTDPEHCTIRVPTNLRGTSCKGPFYLHILFCKAAVCPGVKLSPLQLSARGAAANPQQSHRFNSYSFPFLLPVSFHKQQCD